MTLPYEPRRFQSTVAYYERYRLSYPQRLIARLAALLGLEKGDPVLDLGTGTGMLAIAFARLGMAVTAMDPEPEMLKATLANAQEAGVAVAVREGSSYDLKSTMGPFRLVTIGRAFHWMDRAATLEMLETIVTAQGGVAFFHDAHPVLEENNWFKVMRDIAERYERNDTTMKERRSGGHRRYEPYLFHSAFTTLDGLSVTIRRSLTLDEIIGRVLSMSSCSPEKLGTQRQSFEEDLRTALRELSGDGKFTEIAEFVALLARRPLPQSQ